MYRGRSLEGVYRERRPLEGVYRGRTSPEGVYRGRCSLEGVHRGRSSLEGVYRSSERYCGPVPVMTSKQSVEALLLHPRPDCQPVQ